MRKDHAAIQAITPTWYHGYLAEVGEGDLLDLIEQQAGEVHSAFSSIPLEKQDRGYAPGKWSPKEMLGHITDAERVFQYRVLRFARADATPLPGFEEDDYVVSGQFNARSMADLQAEFAAVRLSTLLLVRSLRAEARLLGGLANGNPITVEALIWIIVGHAQHHMNVLAARY